MNDEQDQLQVVPIVDVGTQTVPLGMQQVRGTYVTSMKVQEPRQIMEISKHLKEEARLAGESFYYGWGAGKNKIEGASVELAMAAARCWGNCAVELGAIQETEDAWMFTAYFVDLETGTTLPRQFRQSKHSVVHGNYDPERKAGMRFGSGQAKAIRNAVVKSLPTWLIDEAVQEAKAGVRFRIEKYIAENGEAKAIDHVIRALAKEGVKEEWALAKCSVAKRTALTVDHLVMLRGDLKVLQTGQDRVEALFPVVAGEGEILGERDCQQDVPPESEVSDE